MIEKVNGDIPNGSSSALTSSTNTTESSVVEEGGHVGSGGGAGDKEVDIIMLIMKFRRPRCTASIWSSGKFTMTGATTETEAKIGTRRCARVLQKLGFNVKFCNYRVVNVLATSIMPFAIKIAEFASANPRTASYEPELHPGVTYKMKDIKATLKIFSTGSVTVTAPKVETVRAAVEEAFRLVYEFRKERRTEDLELIRRKRLCYVSDDEESYPALSVRKKHRKKTTL